MRHFARMAAFGAVAAAAAILSSCVVVEDGGTPYPPPRPDRPAMCTQEYAPVCGERGRNQRTFANACLARAEGYRVDHRGECRRGRPDRPDRPPRACTREYAPVCARRGHNARTFSNACEARAARYSVVHPGRC